MINFTKISSLFLWASVKASPKPVKGNFLMSNITGVKSSSNELGILLKDFVGGNSTSLYASEERLKDELNTFFGPSRNPVPGNNDFHAALNSSTAAVGVARITKRQAPQPGLAEKLIACKSQLDQARQGNESSPGLKPSAAAVDVAHSTKRQAPQPGLAEKLIACKSQLDQAPKGNESSPGLKPSAAAVDVAHSTKRQAPQPGLAEKLKAVVDAARESQLNQAAQDNESSTGLKPSADSVHVKQSVKRQAPQPPVQANQEVDKAQLLSELEKTRQGAPPTASIKAFMVQLASVSPLRRKL
ncbi:hypothetical protein [Erwinia pyrifoliae]|uniref:Uncharacterized protein n=1 Tax=Erwinia pyrifoliae TaxID=79967 RepID=A0ABY5X789_ERWPY|nr:hypothetical protein [Erwinia pyrifoliae]AUX73869.1 hypothetical protein CPI84_16235 [Erwinia pyrifoliae]MCA8875798.1 hypothetical protein [Erwinia pyrifoliae]MCT2387594.1 hypothetical protein [Erwinia pyrifoliae]MCU8585850.1 hypothetical protein [Erwinia pyrifoliae]UWS28847.1 hypothetical protein NYP81_13015 [Erwinia pyrifoliae]